MYLKSFSFIFGKSESRNYNKKNFTNLFLGRRWWCRCHHHQHAEDEDEKKKHKQNKKKTLDDANDKGVSQKNVTF